MIQMDELKAKLQTIPLDSARTELAGVEAQREMVVSNFTDVKDGWAQVRAWPVPVRNLCASSGERCLTRRAVTLCRSRPVWGPFLTQIVSRITWT